MHVTKAVITAAGRRQRALPMQTIIDRDGVEKSVLAVLVEEVTRAGMEEIGLVVRPGDESAYADVLGPIARRLHFIHQSEPLGHGHAIYCARDFTASEPFLHLVGDHLYLSHSDQSCAQQLVQLAEAESCTVSALQATRETLLPYYGAVGGQRVSGKPGVYQIETVVEKPTPTEAEQRLMAPGLRGGHYLCFFGMHVLTPIIFKILADRMNHLGSEIETRPGGLTLSDALAELPHHEQYLGLEQKATRYDVGVKYGLLTAQMALALNGQDREQVLSLLLEIMAQREQNRTQE